MASNPKVQEKLKDNLNTSNNKKKKSQLNDHEDTILKSTQAKTESTTK